MCPCMKNEFCLKHQFEATRGGGWESNTFYAAYELTFHKRKAPYGNGAQVSRQVPRGVTDD